VKSAAWSAAVLDRKALEFVQTPEFEAFATLRISREEKRWKFLKKGLIA